MEQNLASSTRSASLRRRVYLKELLHVLEGGWGKGKLKKKRKQMISEGSRRTVFEKSMANFPKGKSYICNIFSIKKKI